jgi:uncharacterized protein (TIGR03083 family)
VKLSLCLRCRIDVVQARQMRPIERYAAALNQTLRAILALGPQLTNSDWDRLTECPLWTVGDIYGHVAGGEQWMASGYPPVPPGEFQRWVDSGVVSRRNLPRTAVLQELSEICDEREAQLAALPDAESPATFPWGPQTTIEQLLRTRVFDCWVHEQDIRRAVDRPGDLGSPGARVARDMFRSLLPRLVAKRAGAGPGTVLRLTVIGEVGLDVGVIVDDSGRGKLVAPSDDDLPDTHLTLTWEAYSRLSCGRGDRADHHVWLAGDRTLGERVLAGLPVTL